VKAAVLVAAVAVVAVQSHPPPFPRDGVTQLLDNDRVVVWRVEWAPNRPTPMHEHALDLVGVTVEGTQVRVALPDGTTTTGAVTKPGDVGFLGRGVIHVEEAVLPGGLSVVVELKNQPPPVRPLRTGAPDAFPRDGAALVLDNARVAVWDYRWLPDRPVGLHLHHRDTVLVPIEAGDVEVRFQPGETRLTRMARGQAMYYSQAEPHSERAVAGTPRAILVELK
jgi:hypothetical protein